jgi:hypothetical protein
MKDSLRSAVSLTIRPVWRRIWARIETRFQPVEARLLASEQRLDPLEARMATTETRLDAIEAGPAHDNDLIAGAYDRMEFLESRVSQFESGWRQHVAGFLNAVSTVGAYGHVLATFKKETERTNTEIATRVARLSAELAETHQQLAGRAESVDAEFNDLKEMVRALRDAAGTTPPDLSEDPLLASVQAEQGKLVQRAENADNSIAALWDRIEFIRREILFEMSYGGASGNDSASRKRPTRVVNPDKLAEAQANGLRINLGCGHIPLDDYINVDQRDLPGVDVVSDVANLPIEPSTAREVFSSHLIEHFPQEMLRRRLLPYWKSLLAPGGTFRAIVPDGEAMLRGIGQGTYPFEDFREVLFGSQDYDGDFHFNMLTPASLTALMEEAGFIDISVPIQGRPNGKCFEFEIRARN